MLIERNFANEEIDLIDVDLNNPSASDSEVEIVGARTVTSTTSMTPNQFPRQQSLTQIRDGFPRFLDLPPETLPS